MAALSSAHAAGAMSDCADAGPGSGNQALRHLTDPFGRRLDYVRVSVTDRCDLRCQYCLPQDYKGYQEPAEWLTLAEMTRLVGLFVGLGVSHVRLTGGEPLTRRGIAELAAGIAALPGLEDLSLSTNGTRLARHAANLKNAGIQRLNVSLDTLDAATFQEITGQDRLADVLEGLAEAARLGFEPIKVNCVVHQERSEQELARLLRYTLENGFVLRLIEVMPMGLPGRQYRHVDLSEMGARLAERFGLRVPVAHAGPGPARHWSSDGITPALGVITPLSQHFCASCNRVRLAVDGTLYLCLGQDTQVPLGTALREGAGDAELEALIRSGVASKPERHEFKTAPERIVRFMARTGG